MRYARHARLVALLGLIIVLVAGCASSTKPRVQKQITQKWKFLRSDATGAEAHGFDDRSWQVVSVPHTFNVEDGADGGTYYRGPTWYRTMLEIPGWHRGKRLYLRFEGAATVADVFLNGERIGQHRGAFGAFCFDITEQVRFGTGNLLAVRVDNSKFPDVPPLSGDFTIFGGIYRPVHLLVLDPLSVSPLDDGASGMYITQDSVSRERARIAITTKVRNAGSSAESATLNYTVRDHNNKAVASASSVVDLKPGATVDARGATMEITKPRLWNGRSDPYLYSVTVEVMRGKQITDRLTQPLGLRSFSVDPNRGFALNGSAYRLYGINRHQHYDDRGWALSAADQDHDMELIRELGATAVRLAHYQHSDYFYSLCDKHGIVAWAELALVNQVPIDLVFSENAKQQLRELIKQNYNHPSICFWSLFNEISRSNEVTPDKWPLIPELNNLAHALDPTRLTTAATHLPTTQPLNWVADITGFNRYPGWYYGSPRDWPKLLDEIHRQFPDRSVGISEYGAGASVKQHELEPTTRPRTAGPWHPEEWQSIVHEHAWAAMKQRPWLWATFVWVGIDFASDARREGDAAGINDKGLVTIDRKTKKDAFYFYKANWSEEPVLHITSRRFTPRPVGRVVVRVYSNCESVELMVNGRSLGSRTAEDRVFVWEDVSLNEGVNQVRAVGTRNGRRHEDTVGWTARTGASTRVGPTTTAAPQ